MPFFVGLTLAASLLTFQDEKPVLAEIAWKPRVGEVLKFRCSHGFWYGMTDMVWEEFETRFRVNVKDVESSGATVRFDFESFTPKGWIREEPSDPKELARMGMTKRVSTTGKLRDGTELNWIYPMPDFGRSLFGLVYPSRSAWPDYSWSDHTEKRCKDGSLASCFTLYTFVRDEDVSGHPCHKIEFKLSGVQFDYSLAQEGTFWVDKDNGNLERLEVGSREHCLSNGGHPPEDGKGSGYLVIERVR
jgi:hypothetical protein